MRILIAEDDRSSRLVLQTLVVKWGYTAVVAEDGLQAWKELNKPGAPHSSRLC